MIAPPIIGLIQNKTSHIGHGYFFVEVFFIIVSILAFVFNFAVYVWDKRKRDNLLQSVAPLEEFERYTEWRTIEKAKTEFKKYQTI